MSDATSILAFTYPLDDFEIKLSGQVRFDRAQKCYEISHISSATTPSVLPDVKLKNIDGRWVHADSLQETVLSQRIGAAIASVRSGSAKQAAS